jgi:rod shape-determining protein MreC
VAIRSTWRGASLSATLATWRVLGGRAGINTMAFDRVIRRRLLLGLLLAASLGLLTAFFREPDNGALHRVQNDVSGVATPAESVVQHVAQPFRDAWSWGSGLVNAKQEADRLRSENQTLEHQLGTLLQQKQEIAELRTEAAFVKDPGAALSDYRIISADVTARPPDLYSSSVTIDAGSANGVRVNDPVTTGKGWLVGQIAAVTPHSARVRLINDSSIEISAQVLGETPAKGILTPSVGDRNMLMLGFVLKSKQVSTGQYVTTTGWCDTTRGLCSHYPRGLQIGLVSNVNQTENALYKTIQVTPWADLSSFMAVSVLEKRTSGR